MKKQGLICERLKKFGYARERRIRLYGEDLQLVANPVADGASYSALALMVKSGKLSHVRIPLSVVCTLERELEREKMAQIAA